MTPLQIAELMDLALSRAPKLREAGLLELCVDGVLMKFAPVVAPEPPPVADRPAEPEPPSNPWQSPQMYGRTKTVPGARQRTSKP